MHGDNDGNADIAKEIPPNSLQHLNFGENMDSQNENKIEADHLKLQKGRAVGLQKMKQSKLVNVIYVNVGELFCFLSVLMLLIWKIGTITAGGLLESKPERKCNLTVSLKPNKQEKPHLNVSSLVCSQSAHETHLLIGIQNVSGSYCALNRLLS